MRVIKLATTGALTTLKMMPYGQKTIKDTAPEKRAKKIKTTNISRPRQQHCFSLRRLYALRGIIFGLYALPPKGKG